MPATSPPTPTPWPGLNDDIFYHIVSHLSPIASPHPQASSSGFSKTNDSRSALKALACLARSHSSFTQPALAEMWRSLPDTEPLEHLLCVVGIAQRRPAGDSGTPALEMCGTPAAHKLGWSRFQEYTALVREITIHPLSRTGRDVDAELLQDTFWCQLVTSCGDTPILPHLEGATVQSSNKLCSIDTGVLRLLNPSIHKFEVVFPSASQRELKQLGQALMLCFPWIQNLATLSMEVSDLTPFLDMESLSTLHPQLRCVKLNRSASIELDSLRLFANLPNLENLDINIRSRDPRAPINPSMTFPQLRSLAVTCDEPAIVGSFVDHIDTPRLQAFSLDETHRDSNPSMQALSTQFRTLVTKCPALVAFTWLSRQLLSGRRSARGAATFDGERRSGAPLAELLAPLLSHRAMRHFSVSFHGPIVPYAPRTDFPAMAKAWPDLETFHLSDYVDYIQAERHVDIESIAEFARFCPHLCSLDLPMVYFDPSSESAVAGGWARLSTVPHWLQEFLVSKITIPCSEEEEDEEDEEEEEEDEEDDISASDSFEQDEGRCREAVVQFRRLMATVFRSAVIRTHSEIAAVMLVDPVVDAGKQ